jgi:FdrA protein
MIERLEVRHGEYHDSVRLMQASQALQGVDGVIDALAAMATDLNLGLAEDLGFDLTAVGPVGPNDLFVAIRATDETGVERAHAAFAAALTVTATSGGSLAAPMGKTVGSAADGADVALISVPGEHAFVEAMEALTTGLHVMVFSDNVSIEQEVTLKRFGADRDLLVMGPDCGTSIIGGLGLGFANAVEPGPVGIVGASGTGIQELCCLLDDAGVGVRHALGTGSRDLSAAVGGLSTLQALRALDEDPSVELIAVVSKPPAAEVATRVERSAAVCTKPVVLVFMGDVTIEAGARRIVSTLGGTPSQSGAWVHEDMTARVGFLRGLFSGGTLRDDARFIAVERLGAVGVVESHAGHAFIDYGDDEWTRGRAHPMIDQTVRIERLERLVDDLTVGAVLIDLVLGYGAHPDPGPELAPVLRSLRDAGAGVVVSLCGTRGDPQGRDDQAEILYEAGASIFLSNAEAAIAAVGLVEEGKQ